jgi:stress-induced morphogen
MFEIIVETPEFKGLSMVKQHRMINEVNDSIFQL